MALLLCTDLDRTLLPNGPQPEPAQARELFRRLVEAGDVTLVFNTGRNHKMVEDAIAQYDLPAPEYVIGDVGTTISRVHRANSSLEWEVWESWSRHIATDWKRFTHADLVRLLKPVAGIRLQEDWKQTPYKLSYYLELDGTQQAAVERVREILSKEDLSTRLIWSVDESIGIGLLDVLPERASKLHALEYLQRQLGFDDSNTVFAGDSGNDLPVLVSHIPSVLVANAIPEVARGATEEAAEAGHADRLYLAKGGFGGMAGYYAAGILEGVVHYHPQFGDRILGGDKATVG